MDAAAAGARSDRCRSSATPETAMLEQPDSAARRKTRPVRGNAAVTRPEPAALRATLTAATIAALLALGACAVGPTYTAPVSALEPAFLNAAPAATTNQAPAPDIAAFWRGFNDPALSQLVERALAANGDVRIAQARLQEARATLQGAQAEQLPNIGVAADA